MLERKKNMPIENQSLELDSPSGNSSSSKNKQNLSQYDTTNLIRSRARLSLIARRPLPLITTVVAVLLTVIGQLRFLGRTAHFSIVMSN